MYTFKEAFLIPSFPNMLMIKKLGKLFLVLNLEEHCTLGAKKES